MSVLRKDRDRHCIPTFVSWALALLTLASQTACAATLLGIVTERAAPQVLEAAHQLKARHTQHRIALRTPAQMMRLPDDELRQLLEAADSIFVVALFGDPAVRLARMLEELPRPPRELVALHGDVRLTRLSALQGSKYLEGVPEADLRATGDDAVPRDSSLRDRLQQRDPRAGRWADLRAYWQAGGIDNLREFMASMLALHDPSVQATGPSPTSPVTFRASGKTATTAQISELRPRVVALDLNTADPVLADAVCASVQGRGMTCASVFARWGSASIQALEQLRAVAGKSLGALVVAQDFVVGGGEGRERALQILEEIDVPVFKAIRLTDRTEAQWRLSEDGLPVDSVQYRVAMPELQGIGQPMVVVAADEPQMDTLTGLELKRPRPLPEQLEAMSERIAKWLALKDKPNADKRVAVVYYNHPPGRHNVGADNLDVVASLFDILHALQAAGYRTGPLPESQEELLEKIMAQGINLPEDIGALAEMAQKVQSVPVDVYRQWFSELPDLVRSEISGGPLGYLDASVRSAIASREVALGRRIVMRVTGELRHLIEGAEHPKRSRALELLDQLVSAYDSALEGRGDLDLCDRLRRAIERIGIEGLRGWGPPPGRVMVYGKRLLIPGLRFGNVFIGPQPPRGWEVDEELLHANTAIPPPHQYVAFYQYLHRVFRADAVIHLGRHSTYEFLPRRAVAMTRDDYPAIMAGSVPGIYPYIVDGVGEGLQAKRRGLAVMIDHLTPPLAATPLYDDLLTLRQLVESFEAAADGSPLKDRAAREIRERIRQLNLESELAASMVDVLKVRGLSLQQADDELLVHEVGHYLTKLQEKFMPHGLHVFGRTWSDEALALMQRSMGVEEPGAPAAVRLAESPRLEMQALLRALEGRFVAPGRGNDPLRSPEALPTGRNFYGLDGDLLPSRLAYQVGAELAARSKPDRSGSEMIILWASDTVRDEAVMASFGLALMGIEPIWNSRGILQGLRRVEGVERRDAVFIASGLFRDLFPNLIRWLHRAGLLALAASARSIRARHPDLALAVDAALRPGPDGIADESAVGEEPLERNRLALQWVSRTRALIAAGTPVEEAGRQATLRIFGDAPGAYGAGVNRLTERSGAWQTRSEIARAYLLRMGHAYGVLAHGAAAHAAFSATLREVTHTYHGRASNLYGLLDNNDAFDYLGGLSLAVETLTGRVPVARVLRHADPRRMSIEPLESALLSELRGRFLNPAWIRPLMRHGYAGARTFGAEFVEYLWGWQVTNPEIVRSWVWDEVKRVYVDDSLKLGLDRFLAQGSNVHVKTHLLAVLLVAAYKGFWQADEATLGSLGTEIVQLVARHGLPGSGHTHPDHPLWVWLSGKLPPAQRQKLARVLAEARGVEASRAYVRSAHPTGAAKPLTAQEAAREEPPRAFEVRPLRAPGRPMPWALFAFLLALLWATGAWRGSRPGFLLGR